MTMPPPGPPAGGADPPPARGPAYRAVDLLCGSAAVVAAQLTMVLWGAGFATAFNLGLLDSQRGPRLVGVSVLAHAALVAWLGNLLRRSRKKHFPAVGWGLLVGAALEVLIGGGCALGA